MDATGLKVLIPDLSKAHNGYIEAFRNDEIVVFQYEPSKHSEALVGKLGDSGILVADAETLKAVLAFERLGTHRPSQNSDTFFHQVNCQKLILRI